MGRYLWGTGGWFALINLAVAAVFGLLWLQSGATARALAHHGVEAMATVEAIWTDSHRAYTGRGSQTDRDYFASYAFEVQAAGGAAQMRRVSRQIPRWHYEELWRGRRLPVVYLPEDPTVMDAFPGQSRHDARWHGWAAFGFAFVGSAFGAFLLRAGSRTRRLEVSGVTTEAVVEAVRQEHSVWSLRLRFTDGGVERRVSVPVSPGVGQNARKGATVSLRYDPEDLSNVFVG